jgi:hypothetical protein
LLRYCFKQLALSASPLVDPIHSGSISSAEHNRAILGAVVTLPIIVAMVRANVEKIKGTCGTD